MRAFISLLFFLLWPTYFLCDSIDDVSISASAINQMHAKIARPDVQLPTDPQAIAGNSCDLTKVLELLAIIRSRIGSVNEPPERRTVLSTLGDPVELGPGLNIVRKLILMQHDFTGVFTNLTDIHITLTECCTDIAGIFTVLNNLNFNVTASIDLSGVFTSLADIKTSLTTCCSDIEIDIAGIFTVLNNLNITVSAADLSGIFTSLADIKSTLTACCAENAHNFVGTFTVLADIKNSLTTCCSDIEIDIAGIFTVLNNLNINSTTTIDLTGVFTSLDDIKATLTACCAGIKADFTGVFTVLADIKQSLTTCCSDIETDIAGIFTVLNNLTFTCFCSLQATVTVILDQTGIFTTLADIKQSLTTCCFVLQQDFTGVFTSLADIKSSVTNCCTDLSGVYTTLRDIRVTLTNCCAQEAANFAGTFTVLADIKQSLTTCCFVLQQDFAGVFTVLNALDFTCTLACDLSPLFTTLADIHVTLTTCCSILEVDFAGNFTVLADINQSLTTCCFVLEQDFAGVFTVLADIKAAFTTQIDIRDTLTRCCAELIADFAGTFTVLADINQSLTTCCFVLQQDFAGVFTVLADIKETITECCTDLTGIFTVLADIKQTVTTCCNIMIVDFNGVFTALTDIHVTLTDCCADILTNFCNPTLIRQADFGPGGTTPYTISTAGVYKLAEDITYNGAAATQAIIINASNVTYDQQCFTLQQGNSSPTVDGVRVNSGLTDVIVKNGKIQNFTRAGISIQDNVDRLKILDLIILNCAVRGIELLGPSSITPPTIAQALIQNVDVLLSATFAAAGNNALLMQGCLDTKVKNCRFNENGITTQNLAVIQLNNCFKCAVENVDSNDNIGSILHVAELNQTTSACTFVNCSFKSNDAIGNANGFVLTANSNSSGNEFINCEVLLLTGSSAVDAFLTSTNCNNNIFINCRALVNNATGADAVAIVHGFNFVANSLNSCIDCIANGNSALASTASPLPAAGAIGFEFNTTTSCSLIRCLAFDQISGSSSTSIGFKIAFGQTNGIRECQAERNSVGFRLDPDQTTNHSFTKNIATKNTTAYSGFIAGSTQSAGTISNINGSLTVPWSNIAVG